VQLLPNTLSLAQETFADDLRQHPNKPVYAIEGFEELMENLQGPMSRSKTWLQLNIA